jgi:hypothetical protein
VTARSSRILMPYEIDSTRRLVLWRHTESEPAGEWTRTLESILKDPRFTTGFSILEDSCSDPDLPEAADVRKGVNLIGRYQSALGHCRWAVVLREDSPAFYGMLRMAEMLLDHTSISLRPFTDIRQAVGWLTDAATSD